MAPTLTMAAMETITQIAGRAAAIAITTVTTAITETWGIWVTWDTITVTGAGKEAFKADTADRA